ncbi:MAG: Cysteine desulfuration protein SufE [Candidatus Anoxychlamydiales bacterium]|nr:Cysteine desulfuration protein SufE [Candidatus Anoxychlamydiales bacterium]
MNKNINNKIKELILMFSKLDTVEERYELIINFTKNLEKFKDEDKTEENQIKNCQSTTYIKTHLENNKIQILSYSDSLISYGLSALLIYVYNDDDPVNILKYPPTFFNDLKIEESLSPNRSNGLYYMYERLKKDALKYLQNNN